MHAIRRLGFLGALALVTACSSPGGADGPREGGSSGGSPGTGTGGTGNSGPNGGGGSGGTNGGGGFRVSGRMASSLGGTSHTLDLPGGGGGGVEPAKHVTHVVAVTPSSQNTRRVVSEIEPSGAFTLDLDPARLWVLVFVDATKVGSEMIVSVFRAQGLDTLAPRDKGVADLGEISSTTGGAAEASLSYDELLAALGIDPASALYLASVDDMCLRVVNPDVDGNGKIDALEQGKDFRLDFHVQFAMRTERNVAITDMLGAFLPDTVSLTYGGTGIYTSFPSRAFADGWQSATWASFDETLHYAPMGGMGPGAPRSVDPPASVPSADMNVSGYGDYGAVGVMAVPGFDMPQGKYRFGIGDTTLTFAGVRTKTDSQLAAGESFIMPFVKLVPVEPDCTTACAIASIDYVWRKRLDSGWVEATAGEVAVVAGDQGGFLSIRLGSETGMSVGYVIPATSVTGSIPWSSPNSPDAAAKAAVVNATTSDLCHVGLSYDDKLGMRYFGGIENAPHTCGMP